MNQELAAVIIVPVLLGLIGRHKVFVGPIIGMVATAILKNVLID
jgi:hypothetical protein